MMIQFNGVEERGRAGGAQVVNPETSVGDWSGLLRKSITDANIDPRLLQGMDWAGLQATLASKGGPGAKQSYQFDPRLLAAIQQSGISPQQFLELPEPRPAASGGSGAGSRGLPAGLGQQQGWQQSGMMR